MESPKKLAKMLILSIAPTQKENVPKEERKESPKKLAKIFMHFFL